ncbi:SMC-Scp complex subunit ScpB, partial [Pseudomonas syringae pv. tagetis]
PEAPRDETSFRTLLLELVSMEQGLKTDFDDLLRTEPEAERLDDNVDEDKEPDL